jgi:PadR family transcriptional regulator
MLTRSDELILLTVWRLQNDAYGASVHEYLLKQTGQDLSIAGVYAPLKRMTRQGLLRTRDGAPTPQRGGRRRRMYRLTALGVKALNASRTEFEAMWAGLPRLEVSL